MKILHAAFCLVIAAILLGCNKQSNQECYKPQGVLPPVNLEYQSLKGEIKEIKTKQDVVKFFEGREILRDFFFNRAGYPDDSTFINELHRRFTHPGFDTLIQESEKIFGKEEKLRQDFREAFRHVKSYFPEAKIPKIMTLVSGMENDLFYSDSLVIIGLDFFLGPTARYRPNLYQYMLGRYKPETVVPSVMLIAGISDSYNAINPEDKTALADMVAYGKAYVFTKHVIPCISDSLMFGYTALETAGIYANEDLIWKKLIEDEVLYETSHLVKQKYLGERPNTTEISANCPGRIGMWTGMRMVEKLLLSSGKNFPEIMRESDAGKIFRQSAYKPIK